SYMNIITHFLVEGSNRADHFHIVGNDVVAHAAMNRTDRNHCRRERDVELPAGNHLQCENDLRRDDDRVDAEPRIRTVRLLAEDSDAEGVDRGELRTGTVGNLADGIARSDMQSEH